MISITAGCFAMLIVGLALSILGLISSIIAIKKVINYGFDVTDCFDISLTFLSLVILTTGIVLIMMGTGILIVV